MRMKNSGDMGQISNNSREKESNLAKISQKMIDKFLALAHSLSIFHAHLSDNEL